MGIPKSNMQKETEVLYMSFDRFLLAVESHVLSQADESFIRVSFSILQNFNFCIMKFTIIPKKVETVKEVLLPITQLWN